MKKKLILVAIASMFTSQSFAANCGSLMSIWRAANTHLNNVINDSNATIDDLRDAMHAESMAHADLVTAQCHQL